jgi:hypothetical protein
MKKKDFQIRESGWNHCRRTCRLHNEESLNQSLLLSSSQVPIEPVEMTPYLGSQVCQRTT